MAQGMKPLHFATPLLAVALMLTGSAGTAAGDDRTAAADPALDSYLPLVAEFDLRRRVNVLFPNPQTLFDGLQVGFVNVASGNLTFLRRDLVTRANGPLVLGRVYDSRFQGDGDFGPGWRLSPTEELVISGDSVTYVDRTGAGRRFVADADAYVPARPTPRHAGTRIAVGEDEATVFESDGTTRTFKPFAGIGQPWGIASLETSSRRVDFRYRDGRLASVVHGTRTMFTIQRDSTGRDPARLRQPRPRCGLLLRLGRAAQGRVRRGRQSLVARVRRGRTACRRHRRERPAVPRSSLR